MKLHFTMVHGSNPQPKGCSEQYTFHANTCSRAPLCPLPLAKCPLPCIWMTQWKYIMRLEGDTSHWYIRPKNGPTWIVSPHCRPYLKEGHSDWSKLEKKEHSHKKKFTWPALSDVPISITEGSCILRRIVLHFILFYSPSAKPFSFYEYRLNKKLYMQPYDFQAEEDQNPC